MERILEQCKLYIEALAYEAELREKDEVLKIDEYRVLRRANSAILYGFAMCEYALALDLPDEVFEDAVLERMRAAAADMYCWSNVRFSIHFSSCRSN